MTAAVDQVSQVTQNWDDLTNNISVVIHVKWDMKQGMYPSYETSILPQTNLAMGKRIIKAIFSVILCYFAMQSLCVPLPGSTARGIMSPG